MHLDYRSVARAGLLHDLFYYDWRTTKFDLGTHALIHPRVALRNAEKLTKLNAKMCIRDRNQIPWLLLLVRLVVERRRSSR